MKKLEVLEAVVFVVGLELIVTALVIWWNHFIKVQEYIIIW
jgi:hypothetical protein